VQALVQPDAREPRLIRRLADFDHGAGALSGKGHIVY
jgi:hypothetical protein